MSLNFIKRYAPKISTEAEDYYFKHSDITDYAKETTNKDHIAKLIRHSDVDIRHSAALNPNCAKEHLDRALGDSEWIVRSAAARNPSLSEEQIDKALDDDSYRVRSAAATTIVPDIILIEH